MATLTHGTTAATLADEIISFNVSHNDDVIEIPTMDDEPGDVTPYLLGYTSGDATVEAYGQFVPELGEHVMVTIADVSIAGWVTDVNTTGSQGGVVSYSATIQLGADGTLTT